MYSLRTVLSHLLNYRIVDTDYSYTFILCNIIYVNCNGPRFVGDHYRNDLYVEGLFELVDYKQISVLFK